MSGPKNVQSTKSQNEITGALVGAGYQFLTEPAKQNEILAKLKNLKDDAKTLMLMVKDYMHGEYTAIPKTSVAIAAGALFYFVSPDCIPGVVDDALIMTAAITALGQDLTDYREWKKRNEKVIELTLELETGRKVIIKGDKIPLHISERLKEIAEEGNADERTPESHNK